MLKATKPQRFSMLGVEGLLRKSPLTVDVPISIVECGEYSPKALRIAAISAEMPC